VTGDVSDFDSDAYTSSLAAAIDANGGGNASTIVVSVAPGSVIATAVVTAGPSAAASVGSALTSLVGTGTAGLTSTLGVNVTAVAPLTSMPVALLPPPPSAPPDFSNVSFDNNLSSGAGVAIVMLLVFFAVGLLITGWKLADKVAKPPASDSESTALTTVGEGAEVKAQSAL
jgi:hypothetical protein